MEVVVVIDALGRSVAECPGCSNHGKDAKGYTPGDMSHIDSSCSCCHLLFLIFVLWFLCLFCSRGCGSWLNGLAFDNSLCFFCTTNALLKHVLIALLEFIGRFGSSCGNLGDLFVEMSQKGCIHTDRHLAEFCGEAFKTHR